MFTTEETRALVGKLLDADLSFPNTAPICGLIR
jgi:hypothetical protein